MQTTTTPLWQKLNEERTQGEWKLTEKGLIILSDTRPVANFLYESLEPSKANAQYTALAVNNLATLAEALQTVYSCLDSWNKDGKYTNLTEHIKTALKRIS